MVSLFGVAVSLFGIVVFLFGIMVSLFCVVISFFGIVVAFFGILALCILSDDFIVLWFGWFFCITLCGSFRQFLC